MTDIIELKNRIDILSKKNISNESIDLIEIYSEICDNILKSKNCNKKDEIIKNINLGLIEIEKMEL